MEQKKLLTVHHGALGDVVATFPIIARLKKNYGQIDILCQIKLGELAQSLGVVDTYFPLESAVFASLFAETVDPMVKNMLCSYEDILLFTNSVQLERVFGDIIKKPVYRISPRPENKSGIHITTHILSQLAPYEGFGSIDTNILYHAHTDRRSPHYDPLAIVLHPGSGSVKKCWPISNFIALAAILRSKGKRPVFVLGPAEHALAAVLEKQNENQGNIHRMDSLIQLTSMLKTAGGFVGNDSGVSHLAAFLGLPTVVVFGPSDPEVWRPTGRSVRIVKPNIDCHPCFESNNNHCKKMECFDRTTPEMVFDVLMQSI